MRSRILIVDDDTAISEVLAEELDERGYHVTSLSSADDALKAIENEEFDVIVTDMNMSGLNGLDLCKRVVANRPGLPVLVMTAFGSMQVAVEAMRAGAYDFVNKPFDIDDLVFAIERAIQNRSLREEVKRLRQALEETQGQSGIIGESDAIKGVFRMIERVADLDATVLVTGESGTGKELIARDLHRRGRRSSGPFVAINCAAMPESLLESELFGHVKGAFTDARASRSGLFVQATGGTLFLDEIGEMPMGMQVKLLRAVQEKVVRPVGGNTEHPFDARIVAATNRDLEAVVAERAFREDLYYRINVVRIEVPPLRARGNDILHLAQHFVARYAEQNAKPVRGVTAAAAERLLAYDWPGNVRELQNCIERAVALTQFEELTVDDLPEKVRDYRPARLVLDTRDPTELLTMDEVERRYILKVLDAVHGNKTLAAHVLGFDRRTLYRKLERYNAASTNPSSGPPPSGASASAPPPHSGPPSSPPPPAFS